MGRSVLGTAVLLLCWSAAASAQFGLPLRGHFVYGSEASVLRVCGSSEVYWLSTPRGSQAELVATYQELTGGRYYTEVYIEVSAWPSAGPTVGFAEDYPGTLRVTEMSVIRAASDSDCDGAEAPGWLHPESLECDQAVPMDSPRECLAAQLLEADRVLDRYGRAALEYAGDSDGFMRASLAWNEYRDLECDAVAERRSPPSLTDALRCRTELNQARLVALWQHYLRGTGTRLRDPTSG